MSAYFQVVLKALVRRILQGLVFALYLPGCIVHGTYEEVTGDVKSQAWIKRMSVSAPLDHFLLVKKGTDACAVKFTSFHRDGNDLYAEYDWYFQEDGSGNFSLPNVKSGHGKLRNMPARGIGHIAFTLFARKGVTCGSFMVLWGYPIQLYFTTDGSTTDHQLELAPTRARDIRQIDFNNPNLWWYKSSEDRPEFTIPIGALPLAK